MPEPTTREDPLTCEVSFGSGKAFFQIGNDVVDVLGADREPDRIGVDVLIVQLLWAELGVGGGGRVDHQALHVRHVGQQGEDLQSVDEGVSLLDAALDVEGEDGRAAVGEVFLKQRMVRMAASTSARLWESTKVVSMP